MALTKSIGIAFFLLMLSLLVVIVSYKVVWKIDLETGAQDYERSILGIIINSISEKNFEECRNWVNPRIGKSGKVIISECGLIYLGCREQNPGIFSEGCKT